MTHCQNNNLNIVWISSIKTKHTCLIFYSPLSKVLDHQMAADVKEDFMYNFMYILIIFKWQIHKDDLSKFNFC